MEESNRKHTVSIENRESIRISAVEDVESFDEEKVVVITDMGRMTVMGEDFRINRLNIEDGQLIIEGNIDAIEYSSDGTRKEHGGFFGRIFR